MATPRVFTYHCAYCSNLFLASTHDFAGLPKRKDPGLDHAIIVPLPPPPKSEEESDSSSSEDDSSSDEDEESEEPEEPEKPEVSGNLEEKAPKNSEENPPINPDDPPPQAAAFDPAATALVEDTEATKGGAGGVPPPSKPVSKQREKDDYTLILSLSKDRAANIITREDGFEKRWIWRCGRCRLVTGYQLDDAHFANSNSTTHPGAMVTTGIMGGDAGVDNDRSEKEKRRMERKRKRYLYILPGAVLPTEELGRELGKREVDILGEDV